MLKCVAEQLREGVCNGLEKGVHLSPPNSEPLLGSFFDDVVPVSWNQL